uniref:C3H1-type domain-containing protein n=1 Tax=Grammatophora oceanica TaxID=210454 RepID=A0A7S1YLK3_9STRA|mmetsp:Transcript_53711/g.80139  ORF Transcript_53711/g.80139 Transcript_53711/m.80139 type:complete len:257 (+) Transcript_53711:3-773(+)
MTNSVGTNTICRDITQKRLDKPLIERGGGLSLELTLITLQLSSSCCLYHTMSTSELVKNGVGPKQGESSLSSAARHGKTGDTGITPTPTPTATTSDAESRSDWPLDELILDNLGPCYGWTKINNKGTAMAAYTKDGGLLTFWLATGKVSLCRNREQVFRRDTNMRGAEALFLDPGCQGDNSNAAKETRPCRFGAKCSRPDCKFDHGSSRRNLVTRCTPVNENRETGTAAASGTGASRGPCRYGSRCNRPDCWFDHP